MNYLLKRQRAIGSVGFGPAVVALRVQRFLAYVGGVLAAALFVDVAFHFYAFSAPHMSGSSHFLSTACFFMISLALFSGGAFRRETLRRTIAFAGVIFISGLSFLDSAGALRWVFGDQFTLLDQGVLVPFSVDHAHLDLEATFSLFLLSAGAFLRRWSSTPAFVLLVAGLIFPSIAIIGYSYGHFEQYALMSPVLTCLLMVMGVSELFRFVRSPILRPFMTSSSWGDMARMQVMCIIPSVWFIGGLIQITSYEGRAEVLVGGIIWLFLITLLITAPLFERVDRERRVLERELNKQARLDPLTGLLNRRAVRDMKFFKNDGPNESLLARASSDIGVILADVDFFKRVNDISGHDAGDELLREISRVLKSRCKSNHIVSRWGGEEFLILLPELDLKQTLEMAQVLRAAVATQVSWAGLEGPEAITISIGVTSFVHGGDRSLDQAIQDADAALYAAKDQGRNRVLLHGDTPVTQPSFSLSKELQKSRFH